MKLKVTRGIECGERGCGDESDCESVGDGDGHAEGTSPAGYLSTKPIAPHPLPNQSKPIIPSHNL